MLNNKQQQALDLMNNGSNVFLTGKAGTGKSFIVKKFMEESKNKIMICAPTGIAALNVGGCTIHRAFRLPIDYAPRSDYLGTSEDTKNALKEIDTIIIDEISMVRADTFSHVEHKLSNICGGYFGNKQIIVVGDFYQAAPVAKSDELENLNNDYGGLYCFDTKAWNNASFESIELDTVVRQASKDFANALNGIRDGSDTNTGIDYLNYQAATNKQPEDFVTLCFTNKQAEKTNDYRLNKLNAPQQQYNALQVGEVKPSDKPVPDILLLKVGAKVMLCVNDKDDRYVNGTTGTITKLTQQMVEVDHSIQVERHEWEIKEPGDNGVMKIIGTYKQYPIKLGWAITIHKSQGQTITDNVVLAMDGVRRPHGLTYVALSRCSDINNLYFKQQLKASDIFIDQQVSSKLNAILSGFDTMKYSRVYADLFELLKKTCDKSPTIPQMEQMKARLNGWIANV